MTKRTYRPHIERLLWECTSLIGAFDFTFIGWWKACGHGKTGYGKTPKEAYDSWYAAFIKA